MIVILSIVSASTLLGLLLLDRSRPHERPPESLQASLPAQPEPAQAAPGVHIESLGASNASRRLLDHVGYPTPPEAYHESYVRGHSGWYTAWVMELITAESL